MHEAPEPRDVLVDGERLGRVVERSAGKWRTPLAVPLMDLRLEKADLFSLLGIPAEDVDAAHLDEALTEVAVRDSESAGDAPLTPRSAAQAAAVQYIATRTSLMPIGMAIGPFSLMTKLLRDPIAAVALAGQGVEAGEEPAVRLAEQALRLAEAAVGRSLRRQVAAGAQAMMICEPAASRVYISPKQIERGSDVFERFVMQPNLRLRDRLNDAGCDLIFHNCGELTAWMVEQFATRLRPAVLSLGSSRRLWEDAALVPRDVVLYGNLPTRNFYSDDAMPADRVVELTRELTERMRACGHPHILGSECDVLHVPEYAAAIHAKVELMLSAGA